jgi:hypothetical protein
MLVEVYCICQRYIWINATCIMLNVCYVDVDDIIRVGADVFGKKFLLIGIDCELELLN